MKVSQNVSNWWDSGELLEAYKKKKKKKTLPNLERNPHLINNHVSSSNFATNEEGPYEGKPLDEGLMPQTVIEEDPIEGRNLDPVTLQGVPYTDVTVGHCAARGSQPQKKKQDIVQLFLILFKY